MHLLSCNVPAEWQETKWDMRIKYSDPLIESEIRGDSNWPRRAFLSLFSFLASQHSSKDRNVEENSLEKPVDPICVTNYWIILPNGCCQTITESSDN